MSRETGFAYAVISSALFLTAVFHFLVFDFPYGWPWALFIALIVAFLVIVRSTEAKPQNTWAYLFLGPVALGLLAGMMYANGIVRGIGQLLVLVSLSFFAYWLFAPKMKLGHVSSFWPHTWFLETFIPLEGSGAFSRLSINQKGRQALFGALIAIPFVLVFFGLFLSADALIGQVLRRLIHLDEPAKLFMQLVLDGFIGFYLLRYLWLSITRTLHERLPKWHESIPSDKTALYASFLAVLNALFIGFIGFQFVYFFGGQQIVESYGLTYASYAREGFFQLFTVSVLVFAIVYGVTHLTRMRSTAVRLLSLALIVQSWVIIASAIKRLTLYIDAYGLSVLRWWAIAGLIVAALALLVLAAWIAAKGSFESLGRILTIGALYVFSGLLLVNTESMVVAWNASRSSSEAVTPDYLYPLELSSDAIPAYLAWLGSSRDDAEVPCNKLFGRVFVNMKALADTPDQARVLANRYGEATQNEVVLGIRENQQYNANLYPGDVRYWIDYPVNRVDHCRLFDLKAAIRVFDSGIQKRKLADPRAVTWSDVQALKALENF